MFQAHEDNIIDGFFNCHKETGALFNGTPSPFSVRHLSELDQDLFEGAVRMRD